jgi:glycosyltransferase involved in cell wall biosynthesis
MLSQSRPRLAWFSPVPPVRSGIAGRSAELVAELRSAFDIDVYVDEPVARLARPFHELRIVPSSVEGRHARGRPEPVRETTSAERFEAVETRSAHDFVWRHQQQPYDLTVYQFGNSSHHDYEWPYALRYPGLVVLHDTRLHHARAAALLRAKRAADYRAEFAWNHPDRNADLAELAIKGFDSRLYYEWPMVRALVATARLVAVHGEAAARELGEILNEAEGITSIRLGEGEALSPEREHAARAAVRARYGIAEDAIVFGVFGGLIPEKRISQILSALPATIPYAPAARLLLAGAPAAHYDVRAEIAARGLSDRVTVTGYLEEEADVAAHLAACDVSLNLRWPSARETSGPWLRALAAARPTIITDLVHLGDVPALDPRTWACLGPPASDRRPPTSHPVSVAIDIMDEDHSLRLAMRRLATDAALRARLGAAARAWWAREHSPAVMVADYGRAIADALARPAAPVPLGLPPHLRDAGDARLRQLIEPFGVAAALARDGVLR